MQFDTKIAVVLRDDLAVWQKTNVTAFLVSGIAATVPAVVGESYRDASGNEYLPMFVQPVLVYEADVAPLRRAYQRAMSRGVVLASVTGRRRQRFTYSSWRRHQMPVSLRPSGARSSHGYMPQRASIPRS